MSSSSGATLHREIGVLKSKAEKKLATSVFQWKPKYRDAAELFDQAGEMAAKGKLRPEACDAWRRAAKSFHSALDDPMAAKSFEKIAAFLMQTYRSEVTMTRNEGDLPGTVVEIADALEQAVFMYLSERPRCAVDAMHTLVDLVQRLLQDDKRNTPSLLTQLDVTALIPVNPLYEEFSRVVRLLMGLYHLFRDREEIIPNRLPPVCQKCAIQHARCGELDKAIAVLKHLIGFVLVSGESVMAQLRVKHEASMSASQNSKPQTHQTPLSASSQANMWVYDEESNVFQRLKQNNGSAKTVLLVIILTICKNNGRVKEANEVFIAMRGVYGFTDSKEMRAASTLLCVLEEDNNREQVEEVLQEECFEVLPGYFAQLLRHAVLTHRKSSAVEAAPDGKAPREDDNSRSEPASALARPKERHQDVNAGISSSSPPLPGPEAVDGIHGDSMQQHHMEKEETKENDDDTRKEEGGAAEPEFDIL